MTNPLDERQRAALQTLAPLVDPSTYLGGGVAVALHLGHRQSRDLDLFTPAAEPVPSLERLVDPSTGIRILDRSPGTLHAEVHGVPASLLHYRYPLLAALETFPGISLPVASLDDLVCMKLSAIAGRGKARDFWDLHAMLLTQEKNLRDALDAYERKYSAEDMGHVVRSLVYFADAQSDPLPQGLTEEHWNRIQEDLKRWVRGL